MWDKKCFLFWDFLDMQLVNCFGKIWVVRKRPFKCLTAVVIKGSIEGKCSGSAADDDTAATWGQLTGEAEGGLVAADVLAAQWWLEERQRFCANGVRWCVDRLVAHHRL